MKKSKKKKKKAQPKASSILANALALFGPKGQFWITGAENEHLDERFVFDGKEYEEKYQVEQAIEDRLTNAKEDIMVSFNGGVTVEGLDSLKKEIAAVEKGFKVLPPEDHYCSIGALYHINGNNNDDAVDFLAQAISDDYRKTKTARHVQVDPDDESTWDCPCADCNSIDGASTLIISNNDDLTVDTGFPTVRKWFKKAIKLAQAAGK